MLTVFLALGAWRISQRHVLTRRMPAIETLGSATVLCRRQDRHAHAEPHDRAARSVVDGDDVRRSTGSPAARGVPRDRRVHRPREPGRPVRPDGHGVQGARRPLPRADRAPARRLDARARVPALRAAARAVARVALARRRRLRDRREGRARGDRRPVPPRRGATCEVSRAGRGDGRRGPARPRRRGGVVPRDRGPAAGAARLRLRVPRPRRPARTRSAPAVPGAVAECYTRRASASS